MILEYIRFVFFLLSSAVYWFIASRYVTDNIYQSYVSLSNFLVGYVTMLLFPIIHDHTKWEVVKFGVCLGLFMIGAVLDVIAYSTFEHHWILIYFSFLEFGANLVVQHYGSTTKKGVGIAGKVCACFSTTLNLAGLVFSMCSTPKWDYLVFEVYSAILTLVYFILGFFESIHYSALGEAAFGGVSILFQVVYILLLLNELRSQGRLNFNFRCLFTSGVEHTQHRKFLGLKTGVKKFLGYGSNEDQDPPQ